MKKLFLFLSVFCMSFQCEDGGSPIVNTGEWYVKNSTSQTLIMRIAGSRDNRPREIVPGATLQLRMAEFPIWKMPDFGSLISNWDDGWAQENISVEVLSPNGTSISKWYYSERNEPGRQFFKEAYWDKSRSEGSREDELKVVWVFEIM